MIVDLIGSLFYESALLVFSVLLLLASCSVSLKNSQLFKKISISSLILLVVIFGSGLYFKLSYGFVEPYGTFWLKDSYDITAAKLVTYIVFLFALVPFLKKDAFSVEILVVLTICLVASLILISSNNFILSYLCIELQAISLYIIAVSGVKINSKDGFESGIKYFVLGSVFSAVMVYGISLIYSSSGLLGFKDLSEFLMLSSTKTMTVGFLLFLFALFFKLSLAPFHFWSPDVYTNTKIPALGFILSVPKISTVIILARIFGEVILCSQTIKHYAVIAGYTASVLSIIIGSIGGLRQANIKRLLAFSGILNSAFFVMPIFSSSSVTGQLYSTILYYVTVYSISTLAILYIVLYLEGVTNLSFSKVSDLSGLFSYSKPIAAFFVVIVFSLIGVPPFVGFFAKFYVIKHLINNSYFVLACASLVGSVVASFYYLNILKVIYFDQVPKSVIYPASVKRSSYDVALYMLVLLISCGLLAFVLSPSFVFV